MLGCWIPTIIWLHAWRDGAPQDVYFEETDTRFAIRWKGEYRIDGNAFVYIDRDSGRVVTILGYPIRRIAEWG